MAGGETAVPVTTNTSSAARILVAHANAPTRSGLRQVLERHGFPVVAEAQDSGAVVEAATAHAVDVCLIDADLPADARLAASELRGRLPAVAIVVLTASATAQQLFGFLRAGVDGYLPTSIDPERLPVVIEGVIAGETALPRWAVSLLVERFRDRGSRRTPAVLAERGVMLTEREWEVLEHLTAGRSTAEIANDLRLSPVTVRRHVSRALAKLGVADRAAAVRLLAEEG
jgi:DNA-binding NarL/FixJ family response regulator